MLPQACAEGELKGKRGGGGGEERVSIILACNYIGMCEKWHARACVCVSLCEFK